MLTILSQTQVQDYAKWRPVFDELKSLRKAHSLESERVFRNAANPTEHVEVFVQKGKLTEWRVEPLPNGGVAGILTQMGVALPKT